MLSIYYILQYFSYLTICFLFADLQKQEVCNMETFQGRCQGNDVIVMERALYGRMRQGRCVRVSYGTLGCTSDVTRYFDTLCSGRKECSVKVPDDHLYALSECPRDVTSYLEASYRCVPSELVLFLSLNSIMR